MDNEQVKILIGYLRDRNIINKVKKLKLFLLVTEQIENKINSVKNPEKINASQNHVNFILLR